ncbi:MAG: 23S rRNA (pseudouridine(1915)-N(3))-methyltransferase RlmH [Clostridia bacterium]|nr:23S rRNA (pseudouridine(1915)-N(3))-methyltransferase RlmH [Clostridia bacterium]
MNIKICCVGKLKDRYYEEGCGDYIKRLLRFCKLSVLEVADEKAADTLSKSEQEQVKDKEGQRLLRCIEQGDYVIALTIDGSSPDSLLFAEKLGRYRLGGKTVAFVIGGSLGLSEAVLARADERLSLSKLTLPHRLARLILLEQLYRGFKILSNQTYHK